MGSDRIQRIEDYAKATMGAVVDQELRIAHRFGHLDRVRGRGLEIAEFEGFDDLALVKAAALLHDIGLAHVEQRRRHGEVGADVAARFLRRERLFAEPGICAIARAIGSHASVSGGETLGGVLRDGDTLDALGALGMMRASKSKYAEPECNPHNVKGDGWEMTARRSAVCGGTAN